MEILPVFVWTEFPFDPYLILLHAFRNRCYPTCVVLQLYTCEGKGYVGTVVSGSGLSWKGPPWILGPDGQGTRGKGQTRVGGGKG